MSEQTFIEKIYSTFFKQVFPADLKLVRAWIVVSIVAISLPLLNATPVSVVIALPFVLFIPGYSLIAALFTKDGDINLIERIALSIGLSIAVVSLLSLCLNYTPWGIRLDPIVISLSLFSWVMSMVAHYRRSILPVNERFSIPFSEIAIREIFFPSKSGRVDHLISAILVLAIVIAFITTIYVISFPKAGGRFTEYFILGKNQTAADYPELIISGQNYPIFIGVRNHEYRNMTYTLEIWASWTILNPMTNSTAILVMDPLDRQSLILGNNETIVIPYTLFLNNTGYNRVEFLLFNETVPGSDVMGNDRVNASYRDLYLRVNVKEPE